MDLQVPRAGQELVAGAQDVTHTAGVEAAVCQQRAEAPDLVTGADNRSGGDGAHRGAAPGRKAPPAPRTRYALPPRVSKALPLYSILAKLSENWSVGTDSVEPPVWYDVIRTSVSVTLKKSSCPLRSLRRARCPGFGCFPFAYLTITAGE